MNRNKRRLAKQLTNPENPNVGGHTVAMSTTTNDVQNCDITTGNITQEENDAVVAKLEEEVSVADHTSTFRGASLLETLQKIWGFLRQPTISEERRKEAIASIPYFPTEFCNDYTPPVEQCIKAHELAPQTISFDTSFPEEIVPTKQNMSLENMLRMLSEEQRRFLSVLQGEQKLEGARLLYQEKMRAEAEKMRSEDEKMRAEAKDVLVEMIEDVEKTMHCLNMLARMSQAEETYTGSRRSTLDAAADAAKREMEGLQVAGETSPEVTILFQNKVELHYNAYSEADLEDPSTKKSYKNLITVAKAWKDWILNSREVAFLRDRAKKTNFNKGVDFMQKSLKVSAPSISQGQTYFPNIVAEEVEFAQPAIHALLEAIGTCWIDCSGSAPFSPFKTKVKRNPIIPPTTIRARRIADFCLDKPGRFELVMFDFAVKLVFEMKPLLRINSSPTKLDEECLQQVVASLSKYLYQSLNLHGCGTSSFATGLTGTLAYIIVIKLELQLNEASKIGENVTKLKLWKSQRLPLMTKECFDKWITESLQLEEVTDQQKETLAGLSKSLYGENGDEGTDNEGIPLGIRMLWELMPLRRNKLFGPDYNQLLQEKSIGDLLGRGSFSVVFRLKNESNFVLKVPTFASRRHIANEMRVQRELNRSKMEGDEIEEVALPVLQKNMVLNFSLGNVLCVTDGLVLSPKGIPVVHFLKRSTDLQLTEFIDESSAKLRDALDYIHRFDIFHLDVTPKNVVVADERQGNVVLVNFGCACKKKDKFFGFVGTPSYVHKKILEQYPGHEWQADDDCIQYDYFSLALTVCALYECGKATWDMGRFPCSTQSQNLTDEFAKKVNDRQKKARSIIDKSTSENKDLWKQWLSYVTMGDMAPKKRRFL